MKNLKKWLPAQHQPLVIITVMVTVLLLVGYSVGYAVGSRTLPAVEPAHLDMDARQAGLRADMQRLADLIQAQVDGAELTQEAVTLLRQELAELQRAYNALEATHAQQADALRAAEAALRQLE